MKETEHQEQLRIRLYSLAARCVHLRNRYGSTSEDYLKACAEREEAREAYMQSLSSTQGGTGGTRP
ncbi:hypothetical protein MJA45_26745 [Paenibacillus aurantius]|uniref:Uncharacterized protein n=1 Tax=Paenibacillus aurantius TaxID=2918900 RepID=A0AA96RF72_9BACL|nr:hypothetical protein [Paenibacillus aurantius]WNQ11156.1 hypothetical protein MJA45_26745 [Paenibacillus aurantius]